jgi:protein-S-isoprenylcysteine O-methyltransferase Ste14
MNEFLLLEYVTWGWIVLAVVTFIALLFIAAPYGRHGRSGWGPQIPSTAGWVIMESVSPCLFGALFFWGGRFGDPTLWVFFGLWTVHYTHRSWIYPFRRRDRGKTMPLSVAAMAVCFNGVNSWLNGRYLFFLAPSYTVEWLTDPRFVAGTLLFAAGMGINISADNTLLALRAQKKKEKKKSTERTEHTDYTIPKGGLYRWISCPNYLGEIMEWCGWALATWSLPALAFAVWTIANLAPRALAHHRWYQNKFADYPQKRKALLPYLV